MTIKWDYVFHLSLSDIKSPQVAKTFLSILVYANNVVVWMVSISSLISNFSIPTFQSVWELFQAYQLQ